MTTEEMSAGEERREEMRKDSRGEEKREERRSTVEKVHNPLVYVHVRIRSLFLP